jgi:signal transduction histidine kinase
LRSRRNLVTEHPWLSALAGLIAVQVASSGTLKGASLIGVADVLQLSIMLLMLLGTTLNIRRSHGAARGFWALLSVSVAMWAVDYGLWAYFEVLRRVPMPTIHFGDTLLVLHLIPMMMGMALLPYRTTKSRSPRPASLEYSLIACWWTYLYFQFAFVWEYLSYEPETFHRNFNILYHAELVIVIVGLFYLTRKSQNGWQELFQHYLLAFLLYAPTTATINILIQQHLYVSGGIADIPLTIALAYMAWIAFHARKLNLTPVVETGISDSGIVIPEWLAGIVAASIPAIALFSYERLHDPNEVRHFRVVLGLAAMLLTSLLIFSRQQILNRRLSVLLDDSKRAYENLERLQTQVVQSEKLASIGRLVAGAAHELNNPLTAILGYSELLSSDEHVPEPQRGFAEKITQQARRTKNLVSNLLSFARQTPAQKRLSDLNSLLTNACQLRMSKPSSKISVVRDLEPGLPLVMGDDNHLLQVFVHVLNNALEAVEEVGSGEIAIHTQARGDWVVVEISDSGNGIQDPARVFDPFYTTKPLGQGVGLGLSACYGMIQDHDGKIECFNLSPRGAMFRISLRPAAKIAYSEATTVS